MTWTYLSAATTRTQTHCVRSSAPRFDATVALAQVPKGGFRARRGRPCSSLCTAQRTTGTTLQQGEGRQARIELGVVSFANVCTSLWF